MPKSLLLRSKEEALESPAVWLCVYNAIAHAKKLAAGRRHHAAHKEENNKIASDRKKLKWKDNKEEARREQQEYRARKAAGNFVPKARKRGIDVERQKAVAKRRREANPERSAELAHESYMRHKDALLKREYVYNKPVVVKGADGREMHKTFKLKTPHQETHCVCTNRGPAFTKGQEDPSEVKSALIDRAVVQFVRTLGQRTHDDQEFEQHMSYKDVRRKVKIFRIITCLMGLTKMLIFRQPYLKPDLALAQKLWDEWDKCIDRKYGLPKPSPRKNIKRLENLITMTVQNAVGHVFMYKQTAYKFEAGQMDADGKPKKFDLKMLYEVVQMLQPTREMIHQAWCMGLEYNIGTSAMGLNTMTILAEACGRGVGDWFNLPPVDDYAGYGMEESELTELAAEHDAANRNQADGNRNGGGAIARAFRAADPDAKRLPEFDRIFAKPTDTLSEDVIKQKREQLRARREARSEYAYRCSRTELQNTVMRDAVSLVTDALGQEVACMSLEPLARPPSAAREPDGDAVMGEAGGLHPHNEGGRYARPPLPEGPIGLGDEGSEKSENDYTRPEQGARLWSVYKTEPEEVSPGDDVIYGAYHQARSMDLPGACNCPFLHPAIPEEQRECCYCCTDLPDVVSEAGDEEAAVEMPAEAAEMTKKSEPTHLSLAASHIFADALEAGMFIKPQTLVQFAMSRSAYIDPGGCAILATRPVGASFEYKKKSSGAGGAARVDIGWYQGKGEMFKSWHKMAEYIRNRGSRTVMEFDFHTDGLRDCLYLCSTSDNRRRCPEEPRLPNASRPEKCTKTFDDKVVGDNTVVVKVADYRIPGQSGLVPSGHQSIPRDPRAGVANTALQRRLDSMLHGGRMCALSILHSNKIANVAPIRMHADGVEVSVGAVHNHVALVAESIYACALVPGLKNMQEVFCNNQPGPDGLSAPPKAKETEPQVGDKRTADDEAKPDGIYKMPYSYDVVSLAIGLDTAQMLYDDLGAKWAPTNNAKYKDQLNIAIEFNDLPQLSLRYIGYEEVNRQTISVKLPGVKPPTQEYVEAGDPDQAQARISAAHVRRSLGKKASEEDVSRYISRKQGARSMNGVQGDLFASSTWLQHTMTSLKDRGLVRGDPRSESPVQVFADMEQCIQTRVAEAASEKKLLKFEKLDMFRAVPGTFQAIENQRAAESAEEAAPPTRRVRQVDRLTWDPLESETDWGLDLTVPDSPQAGRPGGSIVGLGVGPVNDQ